MAFILILSPKRAPPVFLFEGSTEIIAIFWSKERSLKSARNRLTNSSTKEDFPDPPVPVIPSTGVLLAAASFLVSAKVDWFSSGKFSAVVIKRAIKGLFFGDRSITVGEPLPKGKSA